MSYSYTYTQVIAAAAILLPLAWITAILRCWVKRFVVKAFGADDWLMLMALLLFTVNVSMSFVMANWDFGHPVEDFEEHQLSQVLRLWIVDELSYMLSTVTLKLSITIFLLRLCARRLHRIVVLGTITIYLVASTGFILVISCQCMPLAFYWDKSLEGSCIPGYQFIALAFANSALNAAVDLIFALLPIHMMWNMQMDQGTKIAVRIVLGLGILTCVVNLIRFKYMGGLYGDNKTYTLVPMMIISQVEMSLGIIAVSLATLRPLLHMVGAIRPSSVSLHSSNPPSFSKGTVSDSKSETRNMAERTGIGKLQDSIILETDPDLLPDAKIWNVSCQETAKKACSLQETFARLKGIKPLNFRHGRHPSEDLEIQSYATEDDQTIGESLSKMRSKIELNMKTRLGQPTSVVSESTVPASVP